MQYSLITQSPALPFDISYVRHHPLQFTLNNSAGLRTGSIVHLPSNRDLITSVALGVRTYSYSNLGETGRPSEPSSAHSLLPKHPSDSLPSVVRQIDDTCRSSKTRPKASPSERTIPRNAPTGLSSRASEISQCAEVLKWPKSLETLTLINTGVEMMMLNGLQTHELVEKAPRRDTGLRTHGSSDALQRLAALVSNESKSSSDGSFRSTAGGNAAIAASSAQERIHSRPVSCMRRSATEPCESCRLLRMVHR